MMDSLPSVHAFECDLNARYDNYRVSPAGRHAAGYGSLHTVPRLPFEIAEIKSARVMASRDGLPGRLHDRLHLLICEQGRMEVEQFGHHARLSPGDSVLLDSAEKCVIYIPEVNVGRTVELRRDDLVTLGLNPELLAGLRIGADTGLARQLVALVDNLVCQPDVSQPHGAALQEIMARMLAQCLPEDISAQDSHCMQEELATMARWVRQRLGDEALGIDSLAEQFGYSRRNLYRLFARAGVTPHGWMQQLRLEEARRQLLARNRREFSISAIAYGCGFADAAHFSRLFKKQYGSSPAEWRKMQAVAVI